jgi:hypothetical protein
MLDLSIWISIGRPRGGPNLDYCSYITQIQDPIKVGRRQQGQSLGKNSGQQQPYGGISIATWHRALFLLHAADEYTSELQSS